MSDEKQNGKSYAIGAIAMAGCTMIGMGIGEAYDEKKIGLFIGAGIGLVVYAIVLGISKRSD